MSLSNTEGSKSLFAIPHGYNAWFGASLAVICCLFFIVVFGGTSLLSEYIPWRFQVSFQFENSLPFIPLASIVYISMMPLLAVSLFILRKPEEILPFFWALIFGIIIAGFFFVILPLDTGYPERKAQGVSGLIFEIADIVNMKRNFFPSLHVCFSFTAAFFYSTKTNVIGTLFFSLWAIAISISTLLIHEHYIIDIVAGLLLALFCWRIVGQWAMREDIMNTSKRQISIFLSHLEV